MTCPPKNWLTDIFAETSYLMYRVESSCVNSVCASPGILLFVSIPRLMESICSPTSTVYTRYVCVP